MSVPVSSVDTRSDAELISAVRGGDLDSYGELFARHSQSAHRLARQLTTPSDADDLVADAFAKVLGVLQRGGGPDVAFRAYLLTAVRRLHVDKLRAGRRLQSTDDLTPFDPGTPFEDTAVAGFEHAAAAQAFASLPERWQLVLWHTEVEGAKPADIAPLLGMSANSVSALAYRAREGLRQAYLAQHAQELEDDACRWTNAHLGAYVRSGISRRDAAKVEAHLEQCRACTAIFLELSEVNSNLGAILAPLLLGSAASAYVAATLGAAAGKGSVLVLFDRAKDWVAANTAVSAAASVAVVAAVAIGGAVALNSVPRELTTADQQLGAPTSSSTPGGPQFRTTVSPGSNDPGSTGPGGDESTAESTASSTDSPTSSTDSPTSPTDTPTSPTDTPTSPTDTPTSPTDTPTSPTDTPTSPTDTPTSPTDTPTSPTDTPTSPTDTPTTGYVDLSVSATARPLADNVGIYGITATVAGVPQNGSATLQVDGRGLFVFDTQSSGCDRTSWTSFSCQVTPTHQVFSFVALPLFDTDLAFTAVPPAGFVDSNPSDNSCRLPLRVDPDGSATSVCR